MSQTLGERIANLRKKGRTYAGGAGREARYISAGCFKMGKTIFHVPMS